MRFEASTGLERARAQTRQPPTPDRKQPLGNLENQKEGTSVKPPSLV